MNRTFLVADDDVVFWLTALTGTTGTSRSCRVDFLGGGLNLCWSRLATGAFAAIVLDVKHLQADDVSRALLTELRQQQPDLRVIGFTRRPSRRVEAAARQLGVDLLVCKHDADPAILARSLAALLPADERSATTPTQRASFA